jgi:hypothetical protein
VPRYQPYSRRALRALFRRWAANNRRVLWSISAVAAALVVVETVIFTTFWHLPGRAYLLGVMHTAIVAAIAHLINTMFLTNNREAIWHLRGAWGEENTRDELQRAKRKGLVWGSIDSVNLGTGDIDHLVVTRDGGLIVLDSKWRTESVTDPSDMVRSAEKVKMRAEALARTLLRSERGSHRAAVNAVPVTPAVVLWGPSQQDLPDNATSRDISFVGGRRLLEWIAQRQGDPVDKAAAADLLRQLKEFRASAWDASAIG